MSYLLEDLISCYLKEQSKIFEVNKLLAYVEQKTGVERFEAFGGYKGFSDAINELCTLGKMIPVKSSGKNGMTPILYAKYRVITEKNQLSEVYKNEILSFHPALSKEHYLNRIAEYENDREYILSLNSYLQNTGFSKINGYRCTINERSFEIFNDEKYLDKKGKALLKKLGLEIDNLNCYHTYEAFFYIALKPGAEGNALIIENKDTFMSLLRVMNLEGSKKCNINNINLLIYGEGNKITKSFEYMQELKRDNPVNKIFYYGDLDYPGIDIYQRLAREFAEYEIIPHVRLYEQLIYSVDKLPAARNAVQHDIGIFLNYFDKDLAEKISHILNSRKYIPQEGLCFAKCRFTI